MQMSSYLHSLSLAKLAMKMFLKRFDLCLSPETSCLVSSSFHSVILIESIWFLAFDSQWVPELRHYAPGVPIILVGTKLGWFLFSSTLNHPITIFFCFWNSSDILMTDSFTDLRDDKQFFAEHPGAVPISTAQVPFLILFS